MLCCVGIVKDILLVTCATLVFGSNVSRLQVVGYTIAVCGLVIFKTPSVRLHLYPSSFFALSFPSSSSLIFYESVESIGCHGWIRSQGESVDWSIDERKEPPVLGSFLVALHLERVL